MSDLYQQSLALHKKYQGKLAIKSLTPITNKQQLSLVYTPGVAEPCRAIAKDPQLSFDLTCRGRTIAVISDGSAVLGLGNIGPEAAMPVMEGKALLMKEFAGVDSIPLVIRTTDAGQIIDFVKQVSPSFAGINLEDIAAPVCFQVEEALQDLGIPVFHDDQHGTAIVVKAALINAAKVVEKPYESLKVVVLGAGSAGLAISKMLLGLYCQSDNCSRINGTSSVSDLIVVDRQGAIYPLRGNMNTYKQAIAGVSNKHLQKGSLEQVIKGADVVIGVSGPKLITPAMIKSMAKRAIVFAMANPEPEIMPQLAIQAGAEVVATGRSDFQNQINNVLAFPGIFKAVIDQRIPQITQQMKQAAALALSQLVENPTADRIIPDPFDPRVVPTISQAVINQYQQERSK